MEKLKHVQGNKMLFSHLKYLNIMLFCRNRTKLSFPFSVSGSSPTQICVYPCGFMTWRVAQFFLKNRFFGTTHGDAWSPRLRSPSVLMAPDITAENHEKRLPYRKLAFHHERNRNFTIFSFSLFRHLYSYESVFRIIWYIDSSSVKT